MGFRCGIIVEVKRLRIIYCSEFDDFFAGDRIFSKGLDDADLDIFVIEHGGGLLSGAQ